jgi:hypothetical protein
MVAPGTANPYLAGVVPHIAVISKKTKNGILMLDPGSDPSVGLEQVGVGTATAGCVISGSPRGFDDETLVPWIWL